MALATPVAVCLVANPEITGLMVDLSVIKMKNGTGGEDLVIRAAVVWDEPSMASPCPSFHAPQELAYLGCPMVDGDEEDDEEMEDVEGEEGAEEVVEAADEPQSN